MPIISSSIYAVSTLASPAPATGLWALNRAELQASCLYSLNPTHLVESNQLMDQVPTLIVMLEPDSAAEHQGKPLETTTVYCILRWEVSFERADDLSVDWREKNGS